MTHRQSVGKIAPISACRKAVTLAVSLSYGLMAGCDGGVLDPRGPVAGSEKVILFDALAIMLTIVVPTILATFFFAWKYRASNTRARYLPDWSYSGQLELLVWSVPALVVLFLGGIAWVGSHDLDPAKKLPGSVKPLEVQVVSLDWKWLFIYPELHLASVNQLVIPAGVPVHFRLTSATVMNSFFVPQLGSQIYAMAGMATQLNLQADQPGRFPGLSAQFSGDGFSDMHFDVDAKSAADFERWVAETLRGGKDLGTKEYATLAADPRPSPPRAYRSVRPTLFADILKMQPMTMQQGD